MGFFFGAIGEGEATVEFLLRIASFNIRAFVFLFCCLIFLKLFKGSAANRHIYVFLALLATLLLPVVSSISPSVDIIFEMPSPLTKSVEIFSSDITNSEATQAQAANEKGNFSVLTFARNNIRFILHTLLALYFLVGLSILLKVLISNLRICLTTMHAKVSYQRNWCRIIDFHRTRFWMSTHVELRHSRYIRSPMTWGIINPVILIPSSALEWDEDLIKSTVLHELAHIKRGDWLTQQLAWCVCAIYWINPLIWRSFNRLHAYAETAADDMALRAGVKKSHYAENLLSVAEKICRCRTENYAALSMAAKGSELSTRISAILNPKGVHTPVSSKPLLLALALIFLFLLPITSIQANYKQKIKLQNNTPAMLNSRKDPRPTVSLFSELESTNNSSLTTNPITQFLDRPEPPLDKNNIGIVIPPSLASLEAEKLFTDTAVNRTATVNSLASESIAEHSLAEQQEETIGPRTEVQVAESEMLIDISQVDAFKIAGTRLMQSIQGSAQPRTIATTLGAAGESNANKELANGFSQTKFLIHEGIPHAWNSFAQHLSNKTLTIESSPEPKNFDVVTTGLKPKNIITPRYPNAARRRGIEGEVRVQFNVDERGRVNRTTILAASPSGVFERNVIRALKKSEFQPKTINGQAVSVEGIQEVYRFVLES